MIILVCLVAGVYSLRCPQYSCTSFYNPLSAGQCIQSVKVNENQVLTLGVCQGLYYTYCPPVLTNATCQLPPSSPSVNYVSAGEPCALDENCLDTKCINGRCAGFGPGTACTRDTQCEVGLYCNQTCLTQLTEGKQCSRDEMCTNNYACHNGLCAPYFSLKGAANLSSCTDNINLLCDSGVCDTNANNSYCVPGTIQSDELGSSCYYDNQCFINVTNDDYSINYSTKCQCGYNGFGISFCGLAPGDEIYVNYTNSMKSWLSSTNATFCHTTRRTDLECIKYYLPYDSYVTLAYYQAYALQYAQILYNDECVKNIFQTNYWNLLQEFNNLGPGTPSQSYGAVLVSLLSILYF
jgi:Dickkopf N-terminal cysteine-rich region